MYIFYLPDMYEKLKHLFNTVFNYIIYKLYYLQTMVLVIIFKLCIVFIIDGTYVIAGNGARKSIKSLAERRNVKIIGNKNSVL